jgi:hypothetical protein
MLGVALTDSSRSFALDSPDAPYLELADALSSYSNMVPYILKSSRLTVGDAESEVEDEAVPFTKGIISGGRQEFEEFVAHKSKSLRTIS